MHRTFLFLLLLTTLCFSTPVSAQTDTVAPYLKCKTKLDVPISFPCYRSLWAIDLIDSVSDNTAGTIELGIRKACTGSGFPENKTYNTYQSNEWGFARAEVWARDAAGNASSCVVDLNIYDTSQSCDPIASVLVRLPAPVNTGIDSVEIRISGYNCLGDTAGAYPWPIITDQDGRWMTYGGLVTPGFTTTALPIKNINPTNGLTTQDLLDIQKHILGNAPFDSPYQSLAADANLDEKVSTYDIVLLRKLLLGLIPELPHGKSWRFLPGNYMFPDPANPFQPPPPEAIVVPNTLEAPQTGFYFIGVKIGDVNFSADPKQ